MEGALRLNIGGKEISFDRSRNQESRDVVICEYTKGKKFLLFLSLESARKIQILVEDLILGRHKQQVFWKFMEAGREILVERSVNRFGASLMIRSTTRNEKKWRRRVFIPRGEHDEGWLSTVRKLRSLCSSPSVGVKEIKDDGGKGRIRIKTRLLSSNRFGELELAVVCSVDLMQASWIEIGKILMETFDTEEDFQIFPFNNNQAILMSCSAEARDLLCSKNEVLQKQRVSITPWTPAANTNLMSKEEEGEWWV